MTIVLLLCVVFAFCVQLLLPMWAEVQYSTVHHMQCWYEYVETPCCQQTCV